MPYYALINNNYITVRDFADATGLTTQGVYARIKRDKQKLVIDLKESKRNYINFTKYMIEDENSTMLINISLIRDSYRIPYKIINEKEVYIYSSKDDDLEYEYDNETNSLVSSDSNYVTPVSDKEDNNQEYIIDPVNDIEKKVEDTSSVIYKEVEQENIETTNKLDFAINSNTIDSVIKGLVSRIANLLYTYEVPAELPYPQNNDLISYTMEKELYTNFLKRKKIEENMKNDSLSSSISAIKNLDKLEDSVINDILKTKLLVYKKINDTEFINILSNILVKKLLEKKVDTTIGNEQIVLESIVNNYINNKFHGLDITDTNVDVSLINNDFKIIAHKVIMKILLVNSTEELSLSDTTIKNIIFEELCYNKNVTNNMYLLESGLATKNLLSFTLKAASDLKNISKPISNPPFLVYFIYNNTSNFVDYSGESVGNINSFVDYSGKSVGNKDDLDDFSANSVGNTLNFVDCLNKLVDNTIESVDYPNKFVDNSLKSVDRAIKSVDSTLNSVGNTDGSVNHSNDFIGNTLNFVDSAVNSVGNTLNFVDGAVNSVGTTLNFVDSAVNSVGKANNFVGCQYIDIGVYINQFNTKEEITLRNIQEYYMKLKECINIRNIIDDLSISNSNPDSLVNKLYKGNASDLLAFYQLNLSYLYTDDISNISFHKKAAISLIENSAQIYNKTLNDIKSIISSFESSDDAMKLLPSIYAGVAAKTIENISIMLCYYFCQVKKEILSQDAGSISNNVGVDVILEDYLKTLKAQLEQKDDFIKSIEEESRSKTVIIDKQMEAINSLIKGTRELTDALRLSQFTNLSNQLELKPFLEKIDNAKNVISDAIINVDIADVAEALQQEGKDMEDLVQEIQRNIDVKSTINDSSTNSHESDIISPVTEKLLSENDRSKIVKEILDSDINQLDESEQKKGFFGWLKSLFK